MTKVCCYHEKCVHNSEETCAKDNITINIVGDNDKPVCFDESVSPSVLMFG